MRLLLVTLVLALGCGDADVTATGDAGPGDDAGRDRDAATGDGGVEIDGGVVVDAGPGDAGPRDAGPLGLPLYPFDQRHSPIPADLADALREVAPRGPGLSEDVFAKVGDSLTVARTFLVCFTSGSRVDLDGRDALQATIDHFAAGDAAGTDPFDRESVAATVGWTAGRVLEGDPSYLEQETTAIRPRFAIVLFGGNDVGFVDDDSYARNLAEIIDRLLAAGTVPILSSAPPRDDDAMVNMRVPLFNGLVRSVAQSRRIPFVDYWRDLLPLPDHGLGSDGIHPRPSPLGACVLTAEGLQGGSNVRNLVTLEAFDRARRVVITGEESLDPAAPRLSGSGTGADPYLITTLPFAASGDTRSGGERAISRYDACSPADESGPELRWRLHLDAPTRISAVAASGRGADLDLHVLPAGGTGADCIARDNRAVTVDLAAGDWDLITDTYVSSGTEQTGEVFLVVIPR
jgi:hypothetical protein